MIEVKDSLRLDDSVHSFLKSWFSSLMKGMEKLNDETWPKILEITGHVCAEVHSEISFRQIWEETDNFNDFVSEINNMNRKQNYKVLDNHTISVSYSECMCPLVKSGLVDSPKICECTPNWLYQNFESITEKDFTIKTENTILKGSEHCEFIISFDSAI